ncbi:MAG: ribulokinase [Rectinemataceae bacterium]|nr:ribulokinase [Rectinemataceae bacterium]
MNIPKDRDYVLGVDFGTDSVRVLVVDAADGTEKGSGISAYSRWAKGMYCDPASNRFRQHPLDYIESLESAVKDALAAAGSGAASKVRGLCVDTTGSTPCLADGRGMPLALDSRFAGDPDAMFILWKDHTGVAQAQRINELAHNWKAGDYTRYEGGIYSSEWFWAKALRVVETNPAVSAAASTIIEHCDWMPALLAGITDISSIRRSRCAAGHKAMWHSSWGGYPPADFLAALHPRLAQLAPNLGTETWETDQVFGTLSPEWAGRLGLPESVVISVGAFDAHIGAVGGDVSPGTLLKIMGTSTCDVLIGPRPESDAVSGSGEKLVAGICGQVDGSVIPGYIGYEAGQSAFGDIFAWFKKLLSWPLATIPGAASDGAASLPAGFEDSILPALEKAALAIAPGSSGVVAVDWLNGRRTPDADQSLKGAIMGLSLGTDAPSIYRALVEAAAFGSRAIVERLRSEGVPVERVAAVGGVARKSAFIMQTTADVLGMKISVTSSDQSCALGAAMFAATAAGLYPSVLDAQASMGAGAEKTYCPDPVVAKKYDELYKRYLSLGAFIEREIK